RSAGREKASRRGKEATGGGSLGGRAGRANSGGRGEAPGRRGKEAQGGGGPGGAAETAPGSGGSQAASCGGGEAKGGGKEVGATEGARGAVGQARSRSRRAKASRNPAGARQPKRSIRPGLPTPQDDDFSGLRTGGFRIPRLREDQRAGSLLGSAGRAAEHRHHRAGEHPYRALQQSAAPGHIVIR